VNPYSVSEESGMPTLDFFLHTYAHVLKTDDRDAAEQTASFLAARRPSRYGFSQNDSGSSRSTRRQALVDGIGSVESIRPTAPPGVVPVYTCRIRGSGLPAACRIWPPAVRFPARTLCIAYIASVACIYRCTTMK
jgi:hypothetical protein